MNEINEIKKLQGEKRELENQLKSLNFKGYPEIKELNGKKYIYLRFKEFDSLSSTYAGIYSEELFLSLKEMGKNVRDIKRKIRKINTLLAKQGIFDKNLNKNTYLNLDFVKSNLKNIIYSQAKIEGVGCTFAETEEILENGVVNNIRVEDIQKVINLKRAWQYICDEDNLKRGITFYSLCEIAGYINYNLISYGDALRQTSVKIGGSNYIPAIPSKDKTIKDMEKILNSKINNKEKGIELMMYIMKSQLFADGNKRTALCFANMFLIINGEGFISIPEKLDKDFKEKLIDYYETGSNKLKTFLLKTSFNPLKA